MLKSDNSTFNFSLSQITVYLFIGIVRRVENFAYLAQEFSLKLQLLFGCLHSLCKLSVFEIVCKLRRLIVCSSQCNSSTTFCTQLLVLSLPILVLEHGFQDY